MHKIKLNCPKTEEHELVDSNRIVRKALDYSQRTMISKYSNQREYFNLGLMDHILDQEKEQQKQELKLAPRVRITTIDYKFNDQYEYFVKFYGNCDTIIEMTELIEYYKYYLQEPLIMAADHFRLLYCYAEKKKEILYRNLKKVLNITRELSFDKNEKSVFQKSSQDLENDKMSNFLHLVSMTQNLIPSNDESECFMQLQDKFAKKYGFSNENTMKDVDKLYTFKKKELSRQISTFKKPEKLRPLKKLSSRKQLFKYLMLESTNNSSLQVLSNFNSSKNLMHSQNQIELNRHDSHDKKKKHGHSNSNSISKKQKSEKIKQIYGSNLAITNRVPSLALKKIEVEHKKEDWLVCKKKLRKKSCENINIRKFKTMCNQLQAKQDKQSTEQCNVQISQIIQLNDNKNVRKHQNYKSESSSCEHLKIDYGKSDKFTINLNNDRKNNENHKEKNKKSIQTHKSPLVSQSSTGEIKQTIEIFKSKIRQKMKEVKQEAEKCAFKESAMNRASTRIEHEKTETSKMGIFHEKKRSLNVCQLDKKYSKKAIV